MQSGICPQRCPSRGVTDTSPKQAVLSPAGTQGLSPACELTAGCAVRPLCACAWVLETSMGSERCAPSQFAHEDVKFHVLMFRNYHIWETIINLCLLPGLSSCSQLTPCSCCPSFASCPSPLLLHFSVPDPTSWKPGTGR